MEFLTHLKEQFKKHPSMKPADVVKMCYQAAYGAEHLLSDVGVAFAYLQKEYDGVTPGDGELYEQISSEVCRVNLAPWKAKGLPIEWLFRMFVSSCKVEEKAGERFDAYLQDTKGAIDFESTSFTKKEWDEYLGEYESAAPHAVHHSEEYRRSEGAAYRIVNSRFCKIFPILEKAAERRKGKRPVVIAIDGRAASGKTTAAALLQTVLDADVIHMDDFFLPPSLRSEGRFKTPGENIHHERFLGEVLPFISKGKAFSYRVFDCGAMDYKGERKIGGREFCVVEGSYSCHPVFGSYADIKVFSDVSAEEQIKRIRARNGEEMLGSFLTRWIPMEEEYFGYYGIEKGADLKI